eukprot:g16497.t1
MTPSSSNRLLHLFQLELKEDASSLKSRAPSHGVGAYIRSVKPDLQKTTTGGRHKKGSPIEAHDRVVSTAVKGRSNGQGTRSRVKTNLELENEQLREQLKFQGAVLDQLSGEVYKLERIVAASNEDPYDRRDVMNRTEANQSREDESHKEPEGGARRGDNDVALQRPLPKSPVGEVKNHQLAAVEIAHLRSELREARSLAEKNRGELSTAQKMAEEDNVSHVNLLARERKFRAAVEAGLREKVHIMRRRARDREERLSAELSSVRAQLRETVDLLATKEEEACSVRTRWVQQEEIAAATLAKNKERERHASWLERRLKEVSSAEGTAAALRLEEMTAVLESQQRELELLRASVRGTPIVRAQQQEQQHSPTPRQQQEENQRDIAHEQRSAPWTSPHNRTCFDACATGAKEGKRPGGALVSDIEESRRAALCSRVFEAGCSERTTDPNSLGGGDDTGEVETAPDDGRTPVSGAETENNPTEPGKTALSTTARAAVDLNGKSGTGGNPASEFNRDDANHEHHLSDTSFNAPPTVTMAMTTRPSLQQQQATQPHGFQLEGEGQDDGEKEAEAHEPMAKKNLDVQAHSRKPDMGGSPLSAKDTELRDTNRRIREVGAGCGGGGRADKTDGEGGARRMRAGLVGAEAELLVRLRRCEEEGREWKKEAIRLRAERRDLFGRLRALGREAEAKDNAIAQLRRAISAMESDLKDCPGERIGLQPKLRQQAQAHRLLESRAKSSVTLHQVERITIEMAKTTKARERRAILFGTHARSAEGLVPDAIARKAKAERAKVKRRKAGLTAVTWGTGKGGETRSAGVGQAPCSHASKSSASNRGCPCCSDFGSEIVTTRKTTQDGGSTAVVGVLEIRHAGNEEERGSLLLGDAESSRSWASAQQHRQQQEQETRLDIDPANAPEDSGRAGRRQQGQHLDGPPRRHHAHPDVCLQRRSQGKRREIKPEDPKEAKDALEGEDEEQELELKRGEAHMVERERTEFEAERKRLDRDRQELSEAAHHAEDRVREVEAAWQALAGKVVALAELNADLEGVILKLRRGRVGNRDHESRGSGSPEHSTHEHIGDSNDDDDGAGASAVDDDGHGGGENSINNEANAGTRSNGGIDHEAVPRATLNVEGLFIAQQAQQAPRPVGGVRTVAPGR